MTGYSSLNHWNTACPRTTYLNGDTPRFESYVDPCGEVLSRSRHSPNGSPERATSLSRTPHTLLSTSSPLSALPCTFDASTAPFLENSDNFITRPLDEACNFDAGNTEVHNYAGQYTGAFSGNSMVGGQRNDQNMHAPLYQEQHVQAVGCYNTFNSGLCDVATFQSLQVHTGHMSFVSSRYPSHPIPSPNSSPYSSSGTEPLASSLWSSQQLSQCSGSEYPYETVCRLFSEAILLPSPFDRLVAQKMYKPQGEKGFERLVLDANLLPPIYFWKGSECGICLDDIVHNHSGDLDDPSDVVFEGAGQSASIRIRWPGYSKWSKQICTKTYRKEPTYITRKQAAERIGKVLRAFFADVSERKVTKKHYSTQQNQSNSFELDWRIGPNYIRWQDVVLVSLHNVSQGSWQPQLRLRPRA